MVYIDMGNPKKILEKEIKLQQKELAEKIVECQYNMNPTYWGKFGEEGRRHSLRDAGYHLLYLTEAIWSEEPEIFDKYLLWVKQLFRGLGFSDQVINETLGCTRKVLLESFREEYHETINTFIDSGLKAINQPLGEMSGYIDVTAKHGQLARDYTDALLNGDRHAASRLIAKAVENGVLIKEIYLDIFQKSQYEIGRLWMKNEISVATEHFSSAATQMIMAQLYPYIFSTKRLGRRLVAACVGGELHEIGIRMVTDFFEMEGWDTYYIGANTPDVSILRAIEQYRADVIALSVAMPFHRPLLRETIQKIRASQSGSNLKILIGGYAINPYRNQADNFGADGYAPNAEEAVRTANQLLSEFL
jgi:MerR family transcriptional regulator, light-induced transcriptional regulator